MAAREVIGTDKQTGACGKRKARLPSELQIIVGRNPDVPLPLPLPQQLLFLRQLRKLCLVERFKGVVPFQDLIRRDALVWEVDVQQGVLPISDGDRKEVESTCRADLTKAEVLRHLVDHLRSDPVRLPNGLANLRPGFRALRGQREGLEAIRHGVCVHDEWEVPRYYNLWNKC